MVPGDNISVKTRLITALVALPIIIFLVQLGSWAFFAVVTAIGLMAAWEFGQIMTGKGHNPVTIFLGGFALIPIAHFYWAGQPIFVPALMALIMLLLVWELFQTTAIAQPLDWALTVAGGLYIGLGLGHLIGLRQLPQGHIWVWLALLCTWGADSFAYFGGRAWGKRPFWPRWSPKKTWEGIIAGLFGGMTGGLLVVLIFEFSVVHALINGLLVAAVGPLGDLSISMLKRYAGVKDSSQLIPGHGGFLDRIDSILFSTVVVFYYAVWLAGA